MPRIEINGKYYRRRKGKLVEIPQEWFGKVTTKRTKRKRKEAALMKKVSRKRRIKELRKELEE
jgi:hypothetical protein